MKKKRISYDGYVKRTRSERKRFTKLNANCGKRTFNFDPLVGLKRVGNTDGFHPPAVKASVL